MPQEGDLASEGNLDSSITLRIIVSNGEVRDKEVTVNTSDTVESLKQVVSKAIGASGKFLRLIASGRMIAPNEARLDTFPLKNGSVVHAVISNVAPRMEQVQIPVAPPEPESDEESEHRGFDRFRDHGVTREGVESLRAFFSDQVHNYAVESLGVDRASLADQTRENRLRFEEAWITTHGQGEFGMNINAIPNEDDTSEASTVLLTRSRYMPNSLGIHPQDGSNLGLPRDLVLGFLMGLFLGIIMLFWIWERSVSHRHKMGILSGISCQLAIRYLKKYFVGHSMFGYLADDAVSEVPVE